MAARASLRTLRLPFRAAILPVEAPAAPACPDLDGAIRLEGVDFSYPGTGRAVLHDVTLRLESPLDRADAVRIAESNP